MIDFDSVDDAIDGLRRGRPIVVVDDADGANGGSLIFAAADAADRLVAFAVRHTSGVICVPMLGEDLDRLALPPMCALSEDSGRTAYSVPVDAIDGVTTGISAADRAVTIRALADLNCAATDFRRPGHVFPLRYTPGGVLRRAGHAEAAVDLLRLADRTPVGVVGELVDDDGTMQQLPELDAFRRRHGLCLITIADLVTFRTRNEQHVRRVAEARIPTKYGPFRAIGYESMIDGREHIALVYGDVAGGSDVLVRVHSECLIGDVFGSEGCDCGSQLDQALSRIAAAGRGVVVYIRERAARGIGLVRKLPAVDARDYGTGAQILSDLGVETICLMSNNPQQRACLDSYGLSVVETVPMAAHPPPDDLRHLLTSRDRMGRDLPDLPVVESL